MSPNPDHSFANAPIPLRTRLAPLTEQRSHHRIVCTHRDPETPPTNWHRVAGSARGTGRSSGSLLDEAAATLDFTPVVDYRTIPSR